jgi:hypothetical protein
MTTIDSPEGSEDELTQFSTPAYQIRTKKSIIVDFVGQFGNLFLSGKEVYRDVQETVFTVPSLRILSLLHRMRGICQEVMEPHGQSPWYLHDIPAYAHGR